MILILVLCPKAYDLYSRWTGITTNLLTSMTDVPIMHFGQSSKSTFQNTFPNLYRQVSLTELKKIVLKKLINNSSKSGIVSMTVRKFGCEAKGA